MATPGESHHLHNYHEEIPGGTTTSISWQHDEIIISLSRDESRPRQQPILEKFPLNQNALTRHNFGPRL